jgi:ADP-heptose:LPS heptosyltransferase
LLRFGLRILKRFDTRHPDLAELGTTSIKAILIISNTALGDTLLSTPAISSLRAAYPKAKITLFIHRTYFELFAQNPDIDDWVVYDGGYRRFFRIIGQLRKRKFDLATILHGNEPQATPMAYLSGARLIFKLPNDNAFRFLLTNTEPITRWKNFSHGIDQRLAVAQLASAPATTRRMSLPLVAEAAHQMHNWLSERDFGGKRKIIAIQPGASTTSRRWQAARFREFIIKLLEVDSDVAVVITGSDKELKLAERIATSIDPRRILITSGKIPLVWLPHLLKCCRLLVTGDTGTMHLAIAIGIPVLALFAVSDHRISGPAYDLKMHRVIQKWRTCDPCLSKKCPFPEPICMENISVDEVLEMTREMLESSPSPA